MVFGLFADESRSIQVTNVKLTILITISCDPCCRPPYSQVLSRPPFSSAVTNSDSKKYIMLRYFPILASLYYMQAFDSVSIEEDTL
jgi:hypothetical protein